MGLINYSLLFQRTKPMHSLQKLLIILGGTKLAPGYLTPSGSGTALETVIALMSQRSYFVLLQNPLPFPQLLGTPAWMASLDGQDAIFLSDVDGNLNKANGPAYKILQPV
jgi:hypothetical protein